MRNFKNSALDIEIKVAHWKVAKLDAEKRKIKEELMSVLPARMMCWCLHVNKIRYEKSLVSDCAAVVPDGEGTNKVLYNFLNEPVPHFVENILRLSPNFGIELVPKSVPIPTLIKDMEFGISRIKDLTLEEKELDNLKNSVRLGAINSITNYCNSTRRWKNRDGKKMKQDLRQTKEFLENRKDIVVMRADKGGATVLMKKDEYERGMLELLNDQAIYKKVNKDPTARYQNRINTVIDDLLEEKLIEEIQAKSLKSHNFLPPRLYGLRKINKPGCKLRPVNSIEMVNFLNEVRLLPDYVLVSLDVVSLFTNIPKALVLTIIEEEWESITELVKVPKNTLCNLINVCFETSYFKFMDEFYLQLDRSSMGNPASPVLANIVMDYKNNYPDDFIDCCIGRFNTAHMNDSNTQSGDRQENRFKFPFIKRLSQSITRCFGITDWKPAFYNIRKVSQIYTKLKDKMNTEDISKL
ncbi:Protein of unknown function [Cotesia congregata]|uniref:Reverse transcriptase domain-containing protein n=1 Tax=Cotesia congregata TaxID=51543 RepID=A0A8J2HLS6_COTCN|nr:Protein of unknown function [Cotesia congregata]